MSIGATMKGMDKWLSLLQRSSKAVDMAVKKETLRGATKIAKRAKEKILKGPKTGEIYPRGKTTHTASRKGEAPANDTGNLQRSIKVMGVKGAGGGTWIAAVTVTAPYAAALEYGTRDGSIDARPFMAPSMNELKDEISRDIVAAVAKALEGAE